MSIDISRNGSHDLADDRAEVVRLAARFGLHGPLRPTLVFFGGYKGSRPRGGPGVSREESREDGTAGRTPSSEALQAIGPLFAQPGRVLQYDPVRVPAEESSVTLRTALAEFGAACGDFDPRAPLVVYGYSSGAYNALGFCLQLARHYGWYSFRRGRPGALAGPPTEADRREGGALRVDLLVTVDASIASWERWRRNQVCMPLPDAPRPLVRRHLNYFQATAGEDFHGHEMRHADNRPQQVWLVVPPRPDPITHATAPTAVSDTVRREVRQVLSAPASGGF